MSDLVKLYLFISQGLGVLGLVVTVTGCLVCLSHRRLSPMLVLAAAGFAGEAASGALSQAAGFVFGQSPDSIFLVYLVASVIGLGSSLLLVFGLAGTLADLRRQLARALEPPHVRE